MTALLPSRAFDAAGLQVRLLSGNETDTAAYRELRKRIRLGEGARNFADSYTREDELSEPMWREWCSAKREHCVVGTFDAARENRLISIMMITAQGPADSLVAEWEATWVEPEYRGTGVARRAYEEVRRVTQEFGYQHAVVFIREDNLHSRAIREAQGFTRLRTKAGEHWADGTTADADLFILDLSPDCPIADDPQARAIRRLEESLHSMKNDVPFIGEAIRDKIMTLPAEATRVDRQRRPRPARILAI